MKQILFLSITIVFSFFGFSQKNEKTTKQKPLANFKPSTAINKSVAVNNNYSLYYSSNNARSCYEMNTLLGTTSSKDGGVDTLALTTVTMKQRTDNTWRSALQGIPIRAAATLNSIVFIGKSLKTAGSSSTITVSVYNKDLTSVLYTTDFICNTTYGYQTVNFSNAVSVSDSINVLFKMKTASDSFNIAVSHNWYLNQDLTGNGDIYLTDLPFKRDGAILKTVSPHAMPSNIADVTAQDFDFYLIPQFSYSLVGSFVSSDSDLKVCIGDSIYFTNENTGHVTNPILNFREWLVYSSSDVLLKNIHFFTKFNYDYAASPASASFIVSKTQRGGTKYTTSGTKTVKALLNLYPWGASAYTRDTLTYSVIVTDEVTPTFASSLSNVCTSGSVALLPGASTNTTPINGSWAPPTISSSQAGTYTFTPSVGQCANTASITTTIISPVTPTFTSIPTSICLGNTSYSLPTSSTNTLVITGTWSPIINNTIATSYTFTPTAGQCAVNSAPVTISIDQPIVPTFASVSDFCAGTSAPSFPVSNNSPSIPGTWKLNGSTVSAISNVNATNSPITSVYSFVPTVGQCATTDVTISVKVNPSILPTFTSSSSVLCSGDVAPSLPSPTNSPTISGNWSPSTIVNTNNTNAPVVSTYTFTASGGNCVSNGTYSVTVNPKSTPIFSIATSICSGTTAPTLPNSSNNSIQGTWSPSAVSNTQQGTYEFTPNSCASKVSVTVTINTTPTAPTFDVVQPICMGATAPNLPTISINSISGSWSPAQVSNLATKIYTFTPTTACSSPTTLMVTVTPNIVPSFTIASSICSGEAVSTLATTSNESVPGTWSPSVVSNTTSGNYLFTPTTGVCASPKTVAVTVTSNVAPTFTLPALICTGAIAPVLPSVSTNYITGTWSPSTVSNAVTSTTSYTFTPAAGVCATSTATAIIVSSCAGIDETSTKVFSIYPNPANDFITVSFSDLKENHGVVNFFATDGKLIETRDFTNSSVEIFNVKSLNPGVYFFQIGNEIEKVVVQK